MPFRISAATNDLSGALQRGLFEEEANRNLDAAAQAYQTVSAQFDKDRKLAATAIFRLGEVYRKQNKTNEAVAQYERIVREFADQDTLATLSRQNLAGLKPPQAVGGMTFSERIQGNISRESNASSPPQPVTTVLDEEEVEIRRIQAMIQNSPDLINSPHKGVNGNFTPLTQAAGAGWSRVAKFLLDNGAMINRASNGSMPLHLAASGGHRAMVQLLAESGANLEARDGTGSTALHLAAENGFLSVAEVLVQHKADINARNSKANGEQTPIERAAAKGHSAMVAFLASKGADTDGALSAAAIYGHTEVLRKLLELGVKPDSQKEVERSALSWAGERGNLDAVKVLLGAKADPNFGTLNQPLAMAVRGKHLEIAEALLRAGADANRAGRLTTFVNARDQPSGFMGGMIGPFGPYTPLQVAVSQRDAAMVKLLLKFKGDANSKGPWSNPPSPLTRWVLGETGILKSFLDAGADANAEASPGYPLINMAAFDGHAEAVELLLQHAADVNATNSAGWTPLHHAVSVGRKRIAELLLGKGANPNIRNINGQTPLDLTKPQPGVGAAIPPQLDGEPRAGSKELAELLRQHGALDDLPDFTRIRITRQGIRSPLEVFAKGTNTNHFTLLETVMSFYSKPSVFLESRNGFSEAFYVLPFPDFGRIIIHHPGQKPGVKGQEITVSLLNGSNAVDCVKDVPVEFGDVIEIPESVHALNEATPDPVREVEKVFREASRRTLPVRPIHNGPDIETNSAIVEIRAAEVARKAETKRLLCLQKTVQLVVAGKATALTVESWKEGFLNQALSKVEARAALRSTSDLTRLKVTRKDSTNGKTVYLTVDNTDTSGSLWLQDGDVIEVPDKP